MILFPGCKCCGGGGGGGWACYEFVGGPTRATNGSDCICLHSSDPVPDGYNTNGVIYRTTEECQAACSGDPCQCDISLLPITGTVQVFGATLLDVLNPDPPDYDAVQQALDWINSVSWTIRRPDDSRIEWLPERSSTCDPRPTYEPGFGSACQDFAGTRKCQSISGPWLRTSTLPGGGFATGCGSDSLRAMVDPGWQAAHVWEFYSEAEWDALCAVAQKEYAPIKYKAEFGLDDSQFYPSVSGWEPCSGGGAVWEIPTSPPSFGWFYDNSKPETVGGSVRAYTENRFLFSAKLRVTLDEVQNA